MLPKSITAHDLPKLVAYLAETMVKEETRLNSLDAAIGDGDHGITMRIGFEDIRLKVSSLSDDAGIDTTLREAGVAFMGATGGAIGVLLGKMLIAGGTALRGQQEIAPAQLRTLLDAMETALAAAGKAKPGDKTILDAVHAANHALSAAAASQQDLKSMLGFASEAAQLAAQNTAQMHPRIGRSSRLGDRALGHPDPGAVSFSIILRSMAEWIESSALSIG